MIVPCMMVVIGAVSINTCAISEIKRIKTPYIEGCAILYKTEHAPSRLNLSLIDKQSCDTLLNELSSP